MAERRGSARRRERERDDGAARLGAARRERVRYDRERMMPRCPARLGRERFPSSSRASPIRCRDEAQHDASVARGVRRRPSPNATPRSRAVSVVVRRRSSSSILFCRRRPPLLAARRMPHACRRAPAASRFFVSLRPWRVDGSSFFVLRRVVAGFSAVALPARRVAVAGVLHRGRRRAGDAAVLRLGERVARALARGAPPPLRAGLAAARPARCGAGALARLRCRRAAAAAPGAQAAAMRIPGRRGSWRQMLSHGVKPWSVWSRSPSSQSRAVCR